MNVYLRLLVKPHKKERLLVSNNVLKLASKLLKVNVVLTWHIWSCLLAGIRTRSLLAKQSCVSCHLVNHTLS